MQTELYSYQTSVLPEQGQYIIADTTATSIFVYQAYKPAIAEYAARHRRFGGPHFSFNRMTWIKPNFMWMMYRSGWAQKENQERILRLELAMASFEDLLAQAVPSSYTQGFFATREAWQEAVKDSDVRLQWDPDHAPDGSKLTRRAIQIGIRGHTFERLNREFLLSVQDITDFVKTQYRHVGTPHLMVPVERVVNFSHRPDIITRIGLDSGSNNE